MLKLAIAVPFVLSFAALAAGLQDPHDAPTRWSYRVIESRWSSSDDLWYDSAVGGDGCTLREFCTRFDPRFSDERNSFGEPVRPVSPALVLDLVAGEGWELVTHGRWATQTSGDAHWQTVTRWDETWTWRRRVTPR